MCGYSNDRLAQAKTMKKVLAVTIGRVGLMDFFQDVEVLDVFLTHPPDIAQ
jgi:hypothetical protein